MGGFGVKFQHFPLTLLVVLTKLSHYRVSVIREWKAAFKNSLIEQVQQRVAVVTRERS